MDIDVLTSLQNEVWRKIRGVRAVSGRPGCTRTSGVRQKHLQICSRHEQTQSCVCTCAYRTKKIPRLRVKTRESKRQQALREREKGRKRRRLCTFVGVWISKQKRGAEKTKGSLRELRAEMRKIRTSGAYLELQDSLLKPA